MMMMTQMTEEVPALQGDLPYQTHQKALGEVGRKLLPVEDAEGECLKCDHPKLWLCRGNREIL